MLLTTRSADLALMQLEANDTAHRILMCELEELLSAMRLHVSQDAPRETLATRLELFAEHLADHFTEEESPGGLFELAWSHAPMRARVRRLSEAHGILHRWALGLRRVFLDHENGAEAMIEELESFARALRAHEREEAALTRGIRDLARQCPRLHEEDF
jgi:hypothetical protein